MSPYEQAVEWIEQLPSGTRFKRHELNVEMRWKYGLPQIHKGSWNLAIENCAAKGLVVPTVNDDEWKKL